jgi:hypothetical protein
LKSFTRDTLTSFKWSVSPTPRATGSLPQKEGTEGDEVEIDLDKVTPSTLRFLEKYVAELQVSKKKEGDA